MTTSSAAAPAVHVRADAVVAASKALLRAARFTEAAVLLDAVTDAADHAALAVTTAEVTLAADWNTNTVTDIGVLRRAEQVVAASGDPVTRWDLDFLFLRRAYSQELFRARGLVGASRDSEPVTALRDQAAALRSRAPDGRRRGWAEFYLGVIADNVLGERDCAPVHYTAALAAAERNGDDLLAFEALRHLGDHSHDAGDQPLARDQWERSATHAQRAGAVSSTLAQQLLLAVLARDRGDEAGATLLAGEVSRWADAIGATRIRTQTDAFIAGVDPTRPPADDETAA